MASGTSSAASTRPRKTHQRARAAELVSHDRRYIDTWHDFNAVRASAPENGGKMIGTKLVALLAMGLLAVQAADDFGALGVIGVGVVLAVLYSRKPVRSIR